MFTTGQKTYKEEEQAEEKRGKVCDLVVPVVTLIICCIIGMIYTGGFFKGTSFVKAFSESDASVGLAIGSIFALMNYYCILCCKKNFKLQEVYGLFA